MKKPLSVESVKQAIRRLKVLQRVADSFGTSKATLRVFMKKHNIAAYYRVGEATKNRKFQPLDSEVPRPVVIDTYLDTLTGFPVQVFSDGYAWGFTPQKNVRQRS